jgi:hypothetical protein
MRRMSFPEHTPASPQGGAPFGHPSTWPAPQSVAAAPPKRRMVAIILAVAGVLALVAGTGVTVYLVTRPSSNVPAAAASPSAAAFTAAGTLLLKRGEFSWNSAADPTCQGLNGFSDLRGGTQVTVTDAAGKKLAIGVLANGRAGDFTTDSDGAQRAASCALSFAVTGVPRGVGPYGVEISHRGVQNYNEAQLDAGVTLRIN